MTNKKSDKETTSNGKKNADSNGAEPTPSPPLPIKTNCRNSEIQDEFQKIFDNPDFRTAMKKALESGELPEMIGFERRHMEFSCGPIPTPDKLGEYQKVDPKIVQQFLTHWSKEMDHRHKIDDKRIAVQEEYNKQVFLERKRGQTCATIICFAAFIASVLIAFFGHPTTAGIIGGTSLAGIVATFIMGRLPMFKSKNEKGRQVEPEKPAPPDKDL